MSDEYETLGEAIEYLQGLVTDGCNGRVVLDVGHDPTLCPVHDPFPAHEGTTTALDPNAPRAIHVPDDPDGIVLQEGRDA